MKIINAIIVGWVAFQICLVVLGLAGIAFATVLKAVFGAEAAHVVAYALMLLLVIISAMSVGFLSAKLAGEKALISALAVALISGLISLVELHPGPSPLWYEIGTISATVVFVLLGGGITAVKMRSNKADAGDALQRA